MQNFGVIGILVWVVATGMIYLTVCCTKMFMKINKIDSLPCDKHHSEINELAKISARLDEKTEKVTVLPCDKHREQIFQHECTMVKLETSIEYLGNEISTAVRSFQQKNINADGYTKTMSPLAITEKGKEMVKRLKLDEMFEKNWPRIKEVIRRESESDAPYDVDKCCREQAVVFPEKFLTRAEIDILKDDAYQKGLLLASYMKVLAVMARDKYLLETKP